MVTVATMRAHPEAICNGHVATWDCTDWHKPKAITELAVIETPPIRGARSYSAVMHEIGHCLGRYQYSQRCFTREKWAWDWARCNVLLWTAQMERSAQTALN